MDYPFNLGRWSRAVTTTSPEAQLWFDRGLNWLFSYNHEEAVTCFRRALDHDPDCAMAHWGVALAGGAFYNRPWIRYSAPEIANVLPVCHAASQAALACAPGTEAEQALIRAVALRYQRGDTATHAELNTWQNDYCGALRAAHRAYPDDLDIAALFAEAMLTRTPRQLWDLVTGAPRADSDITEALAVLEGAMARARARGIAHPGLLHIYIHAIEMSPFPEKGLPAADALTGVVPDSGHMEHMSAHIYILTGDYAQAVRQSKTAIRADDTYLAYAGAQNFYTTARFHDLHLMIYAAMFLGQYQTAMAAADQICAEATPELMAWAPPFMASMLDGYAAMRVHVLVRFGQWRTLTLMNPPPNPGLTPVRMAMHYYGKGVAHAALGEIAEAEAARAAYYRACGEITEDAIFLSNPVRVMLRVGEAMLDGELEYRKGNYDIAFDALRLAVARDDALNYTEPWAWMHPPRHALGALLLEQGRVAEAESVYRADLGLATGLPRCCQHPDNIWALQGLLDCMQAQGESPESRHLRQRLDIARIRADVKITASCCCKGMALADATERN